MPGRGVQQPFHPVLQHLVERGGLLGGVALARGDQQEPPVTPGAALRARDHLPANGPVTISVISPNHPLRFAASARAPALGR